MDITLFYAYLSLLQFRQFDCSVVLPLLNMIPNKLIRYPGGLLPGKLNVLKSRIMAYDKTLAAFAANNSFHKDCGRRILRRVPQASGNTIGVHQRGPRR
jgi:hypothetical protein